MPRGGACTTPIGDAAAPADLAQQFRSCSSHGGAISAPRIGAAALPRRAGTGRRPLGWPPVSRRSFDHVVRRTVVYIRPRDSPASGSKAALSVSQEATEKTRRLVHLPAPPAGRPTWEPEQMRPTFTILGVQNVVMPRGHFSLLLTDRRPCATRFD